MKEKHDIKVVHKLLSKRRSIVSFSSEMPDDESLQLLFKAASRAPSSYNQQPWRFIYTTRKEDAYVDFYNLLADGNKTWAGTAPVFALSLAEVITEDKNRPNPYAFHDLGMAVGNLLTQATWMGLYVHQMGGYDLQSAKKLFNIPERFEPGAVMAIGYPGEIDHLSVELKRRELQKRTRKEINEFVFKNTWGQKI